MSIVGPRPEIRKWVDAYPEKWKEILTVRPGITDNASILFRKEEYLLAESANPEQTYKDLILPEKMELYEQYVVSHSFVGDIKLIIKTFRNLFR
jgi:lipopolysaccharide/colanic/teichoic acid biosynthesis glycosyltransferase